MSFGTYLGFEKLCMSDLTDFIAPTTVFGVYLLRKSRMHVSKNINFNFGNMAS